jgi:uncharacterized protein (DUF2141 family)
MTLTRDLVGSNAAGGRHWATAALIVTIGSAGWLPVPQVAARQLASSTGSLTVRVTAPGATTGEIGCALYASAAGFPLDAARAAATQVHPARPSVACRFEGLAAGTYAVAVSHDLNGNRKTDRNFVGIPKEAWGVSNGVRPAMRAPRFDEAAVKVNGATEIAIEVRR